MSSHGARHAGCTVGRSKGYTGVRVDLKYLVAE